MSEIDNGGSAFPVGVAGTSDNHSWLNEGMSLRDYLAAHVNIPWEAVVKYAEDANHGDLSYLHVMRYWAQMRYAFADEMIKTRKEKP